MVIACRWTNVKPPLIQRLVSAGYMWPDHADIGRPLRVNKHAWTAHQGSVLY